MSVVTKLAEFENTFSLLCNANKSKEIEPENKNTDKKQKHEISVIPQQAPKFAMSYAKTAAENNDNIKRQQQERLQLRGQGRGVDSPLVGAPEPIRKVFVSRMNCDTTISSLKN